MSQLIQCNVLQTPEGNNFQGQANPCPQMLISVSTIENVTTAGTGITTQTGYAGVQSVISVRYQKSNDVQTGAYWVAQDQAAILSAANS